MGRGSSYTLTVWGGAEQFQGSFRALSEQLKVKGLFFLFIIPLMGLRSNFMTSSTEQFRSSSGAILEQFRRSFEATQAQFRNNCKLLCTNSLGTFLQFQSNFRAVGAQFPIDLK